MISDRTWLESGSNWLKIAPLGFRKLLKYIKDEYGDPPILVTENGVSENGPVDLNDEHRSYFYENYINEMLKGIKAVSLNAHQLERFSRLILALFFQLT